jgi:bacillithiol synthase
MHIIAKTDPLLSKDQSNHLFDYQMPETLKRVRDQIALKTYPRAELVDKLREYNLSIGNDTLSLKNVEALADSKTVCIFTGQQLGFMGGPAYTILKGISCLLMAKAAAGIPLFWLATEDHDVAEIDHTYLLDHLGNLQNFTLSLPKDGRPVEDLTLNKKNIELIRSFLHLAKVPKNQWPEMKESYTQTMAQFLAKLFLGTGMVFLEPHLLRSLAVPFFRKEIEEAEEIQLLLNSTTERLQSAGQSTPLEFNVGATNLFLKLNGYRRKLLYKERNFIAAGQSFSKEDLLAMLDHAPERFSTNVAARPVLQSSLFPTLVYVAGATESLYYQQLNDYHDFHQTPMPFVMPRHEISFIPTYAAQILQKCGLNPWDTLPQHWAPLMPQLREGVDNIKTRWYETAIKELRQDYSSEMLKRFVNYVTRKLENKVVRSRLKKQHIPLHGLHLLRNLLHPHEKLQERVLNWWAFQGHTEENILLELLAILSPTPKKELYCFLT